MESCPIFAYPVVQCNSNSVSVCKPDIYRTARDFFTFSSPIVDGGISILACVDQNGKPRALPEWRMPGVTKWERSIQFASKAAMNALRSCASITPSVLKSARGAPAM